MKNCTFTFLSSALFICIFFITGSNNAMAVENSQCMECHGVDGLFRSETEDINRSYISTLLFVDEDKFNHSVHHANGVVCVDCHSDIKELNYDEDVPHNKVLAPVNCKSCHEEQAEAFLSSSHMKARRKGIVMNCYACHDYHYVSYLASASVHERGNTFCLRCHNPFQSHDWLPQKAAHFDSVECSVCHAPQTRRYINLGFYDLVSTRTLTGDEILQILSIREDEFMAKMDVNKDGSINSDEFDNLMLMLRQKSVRTIVHAELVVTPEAAVHSVSKEEAVRECRQCHAPDSPFFSSVNISLSRSNGTVDRFEVDRAILEGYHTSHFSALAGTRIRLLDKIGFLMMAGAVSLVMFHMLVRIATIPLRRKRENGGPVDEKIDDSNKDNRG
jgi:predicted CXXCH cytochrome family protein